MTWLGPAPAAATDLATKGYVDTAVGLLVPSSYLDTDGTLAANSDTKVPTQKAVKTYVAAASPWLPISDTTLDSDYAAVSINCPGYGFLRLTIMARSAANSATGSLRGTFNNDSTSTYSVNNSALVGYISWGAYPGSLTNQNRWGITTWTIGTSASAYTIMTGSQNAYVASNGTGAVPAGTFAQSWSGSVSAALSSVQFYMASGNIAAGSRFFLEGKV